MALDIDSLEAELHQTLAAITEAQTSNIERAATVATYSALMAKSWTLRYQLASARFDLCDDADLADLLARQMVDASKQAEAWAKRLGQARKAIADDDIIEADQHDQRQAALATKLRLLAGG